MLDYEGRINRGKEVVYYHLKSEGNIMGELFVMSSSTPLWFKQFPQMMLMVGYYRDLGEALKEFIDIAKKKALKKFHINSGTGSLYVVTLD